MPVNNIEARSSHPHTISAGPMLTALVHSLADLPDNALGLIRMDMTVQQNLSLMIKYL